MIITELRELEKWLRTLTDVLEFDVETTGLTRTDSLTSIQLGNGKNEIFIPVNQPNCIPLKLVVDVIKDNFADPKIVKIAHNIKFDAYVLKRNGVEVSAPYCDTMVMAAIKYPDLRRKAGRGWRDKYALKALTAAFLEIESPNWKEFLALNKIEYETKTKKGKVKIKKKTPKSLAELPLEKQMTYANSDIVYTRGIKKYLEERMTPEEKHIFWDIEMRALPILFGMEKQGITIDVNAINRKIEEWSTKILELEEKIYAEAGHKFTISSEDELRQVLVFEKMVPLTKVSRKSQKLCLEKEVLEAFAESFPICQHVVEWRKFKKYKSTYGTPYLKNTFEDGKLHSNFGITATGRLTSSDPNLQNIPKRDDEAAEIRDFFVASPDHKLLSCDYSQMEIVMIAEQSQSQKLINDIWGGVDLHMQTAMFLWKDPERRPDGKTTNFALLFGQADFTLAKTLKVRYWDARNIYDKYFALYPGVKEWFTGVKMESNLSGVVTTLLGRSRNLMLANPNPIGRANQALNTPIQGSCADLVKIAMVRWDKIKKREGFKTNLILQVHDELLFEAPDDEVAQVIPYIKGVMESIVVADNYVLGVPMRVAVEVKSRWGEKEEE